MGFGLTEKNSKMVAIVGAVASWFAVIAQFYIMLETREVSALETAIRFFSYFTMLTNTILAIYFTTVSVGRDSRLYRFFRKPGVSTALVLYILIVCFVYQLMIRHTWSPTGLQKLVDEILHSVMPAFMFAYWILFELRNPPRWKQVGYWLIFPAVYIGCILARGFLSGFYPYSFINGNELTVYQIAGNTAGLMITFAVNGCLLVILGRLFASAPIFGQTETEQSEKV